MVQLTGVFNYLPIDRVIYGNGSINQINDLLEEYKIANPLILTSSSVSASKSFLDFLGKLKINYTVISNVTQHSPLSEIERAVDIISSKGCDGIITYGGGSVIDSGKAIRYYHGTDVKQIAIPTTLSAAEFSHIAGFTNEGEKQGIRDKKLTVSAIFLDPSATMETPEFLWNSSGIRSIDHCVETIIQPNISEIGRHAALRGIELLFKNIGKNDVGAHFHCQIGEWYSYFQVFDSPMGISHQIGKIIGAKFNIPHGVTSCITLPITMKYYAKIFPQDMKEIASSITGRDLKLEKPENAVFLLNELLETLNLRKKLSDYGVTEKDYDYISSKLKSPEDWQLDLVRELIREN